MTPSRPFVKPACPPGSMVIVVTTITNADCHGRAANQIHDEGECA